MANAYDSELNNYNQEVDGIEILVDMAKKGTINPWNIDIIDVTDKYLAHMFQSKAQNLKFTGRTLLFAAILLKLKSNILEGVDLNEIENGDEENSSEISMEDLNDDGDLDYSYTPESTLTIDEVLQRRTSVKLNRKRVVTLKDLIRQLEFYEMLDKKQALKSAHDRAKSRVRSYAKFTPDDIINLAQDEYLKLGVEKLRANLADIFTHNKKIELNDLLVIGMDNISAYLSLLFLVPEGVYDIEQEEFYSDVYIKKFEKTQEESIINNQEKDDVIEFVNSISDNEAGVIQNNGELEIKN